MTVRLRSAVPGDAAVLAELAGELGYSKSAEAMAGTLARLLPRDDQLLLVAERAGQVVAWLHAAEREALESPRRLEVMGLVVAGTQRGQGLGAALMDAAESWGRARGLEIVQLRSNIQREAAHRFYRRIGYASSKTSLLFQKPLSD